MALQRKKKDIHNKLPNLPYSLMNSTEAQLNRINHDINTILAEKARGAVIQSRCKWEFLAERPTRYYLNLGKQNFLKKTIYRLKDENDQIISDPATILKMQNKFYQNLYTAKTMI